MLVMSIFVFNFMFFKWQCIRFTHVLIQIKSINILSIDFSQHSSHVFIAIFLKLLELTFIISLAFAGIIFI